ncbi:MAG: hypothetical protein GY880_22125 [Planctomycetaceae bacterium]|nr:hypothetical protein [Planctomycetaceae bacterium]
MPRPKAEIPKYSRHTNGQARVRINGKATYLGKYRTPSSFAKNHAVLAAHDARRQDTALPDTTEPTVRVVCADYRQRRLLRYDSQPADQGRRVGLDH